jgi:Pyridoxamine 5'-phosphate oxidase
MPSKPSSYKVPWLRQAEQKSARCRFVDQGVDAAASLAADCVCRRGTGGYVQEMEIINLGTADGLPPVDWAAVVEKLDAGSAPAADALNSRTTWLSTVNEDGSPHVTAVGALWMDGTFWFQTGAGTRKGRNVARDPRCSVAMSIRDADVVVEGDAARVTEPRAVARIAKAWADNGWPAEPDESGSGITAPFNAPSQGPPPWNVYRIEARSATVVLATEPGGLTRFCF